MEQDLRQLINQLDNIQNGLSRVLHASAYNPANSSISYTEQWLDEAATMTADTPLGQVPGIDKYTPASGDFTMTKSNRMPPGEMPPGATPHPGNPEDLYVYKGLVFRKETGYQLSKDSPMLQPGWFARHNTDIHGNKRGSYQVIDVVPVQAKTTLPTSARANEMDRIQRGLNRDMKIAGNWDYKGASITLWYRPEGGQGQKWEDVTRLAPAMELSEWAKLFKPLGYGVKNPSSWTARNSLGNALGTDLTLLKGVSALHFAGAAQMVAFKTAGGNGMAVVDTTFLGPESVWQAGGKEAWSQVMQSIQMSSNVQPL